MTRIFCYLTVVTLQYLVPVFLILFSTLALKALGKSSPGSTEYPLSTAGRLGSEFKDNSDFDVLLRESDEEFDF